jgi:formylglycine-generating enzyme required for sulfatase activity
LSYTSTDSFCDQTCHSHPHATQFWIQSAHYSNKSGVVTHCVDCHLPPGGIQYLTEKARLGARDAYGRLFRDVSKIDWARERQLDHALIFTYDSACIRCHNNLFSQGLSKVAGPLPSGLQETNAQQLRETRMVARRLEAHLYYQRNREKLHCVNCHLSDGHLMEKKTLFRTVAVVENSEFPLVPSGFQNYTEVLPGSTVKFHMIAVAGGTLQAGSPELGACRQHDAGPVHAVSVSPFWMAQATVSGHELDLFYVQRKWRGKDPSLLTQQVAEAYSQWLSQVTGKKYRLPTEAELEYACVASGTMPSWKELASRADSRFTSVAELNAWGFVDLPDHMTELCLDYPQNAESAWWYSDRVGVKFRVVREPSESTVTNRANMEP